MSDYGQKISNALRAVRRMHSDTSRLLRDCDGPPIGNGNRPIFGNVATRDLTRHVSAKQWMAEAVFRYYDAGSPQEPGLVEGICVYFLDRSYDKFPKFEEPLLIVGRIKYRVDGDDADPPCDGWDLWHAFFDWNNDKTMNKVLAQPLRRIGASSGSGSSP